MKFNYLFVDPNNGHFKTYHPFNSDTVLHQDRVTEWLMQIPGSSRMGTNFKDLLYRLDKEKIPFEEFTCPCCNKTASEIKNFRIEVELRMWSSLVGVNFILLEGISGNY